MSDVLLAAVDDPRGSARRPRLRGVAAARGRSRPSAPWPASASRPRGRSRWSSPALAVLLLLARHRRVPATAAALALGAAAFARPRPRLVRPRLPARMGPEPLVHFFFRENLERFAGEGFDVGRPAWFYLPAYFAEGLPWSPLPARRRPEPAARRRGRPAPATRAGSSRAWAALVLVPLSLSRGKIDYYLLPLYPAVSLLVGRYLAEVPWRRLDRAWIGTCLAALGSALAWMLLGAAAGARRVAARRASGASRSSPCSPAPPSCSSSRAARPTPAPRRGRARSARRARVARARRRLPAGLRGRPAEPCEVAEDVARELSFRTDARVAICGDPSRARRDVLFHARAAAVETCDLWSLAASREAVPAPRHPGAGRVARQRCPSGARSRATRACPRGP